MIILKQKKSGCKLIERGIFKSGELKTQITQLKKFRILI